MEGMELSDTLRGETPCKPGKKLVEAGVWQVPPEERPKNWKDLAPVTDPWATHPAIAAPENAVLAADKPKKESEAKNGAKPVKERRKHRKKPEPAPPIDNRPAIVFDKIETPEGVDFSIRIEPGKEMTATKRVEERVETRVTESTVTVTESAPALPAPQEEATSKKSLLVQPCVPNYQVATFYLPADGTAAARALDVLIEMADIEDADAEWQRYDTLMTELWDRQAEAKQYRDAKKITDSILKPWLEEQMPTEWQEDEIWINSWKDLWQRVHGALMDLMVKEEARHDRAVKKEREENRAECDKKLKAVKK